MALDESEDHGVRLQRQGAVGLQREREADQAVAPAGDAARVVLPAVEQVRVVGEGGRVGPR